MIVTAIFLLVLIGGMVIGMPIAHALVLTGVALMWHLDFFDSQLLAQNLQAGFDNFPLLAVPFFILAGELMNAGGLSRRIIDLARAFVGHIRGGLGFVVIGAAVLLASMSGSAIADTAALATILLPMMREQKYPMSYSAGLLASGGIIAPIIPPSMPFVIYGVTTNTSISKLFLSGVAPGLMMGIFLIGAWAWIARRHDLPSMERVAWGPRMKALTKSFWAMMMPVIILGGLRGGIFTPTEAAAVAVAYGLLIALFVYRDLKFRDITGLILRAAALSAAVMTIIGTASIFGWLVASANVPELLSAWIKTISTEAWTYLIIVNILLMLIGMFMESLAAILILVPVLMPIAIDFGINPVHFGLVVVMNFAIGMVTPPYGITLFVAASVAERDIIQVARRIFWPWLMMTLILLLVTFVPEIGLFLPRLAGLL